LIILWDISGKKRDIAIAEMHNRVGQEGDRDRTLDNIENENDIIIMNVIINMQEEMNVIIEDILAPVQRNVVMMKKWKLKKDNKKFDWL